MADDDGGRRIAFELGLQPQGAFQVEVVGGFVQQQQVGFGEQGRGQGHAHAPAAGELGHRPFEVGVREAEAGQDLRRSGGGAVRSDLDQAAVDVGDALGRRRLQLGEQGVALDVGGQHGLDQADRRGGRFLVHRGDAVALGHGHLAGGGGQFAQDDLEQGRLADAVAAHQADLGAGRDGRVGAF